MRALVVIGTSFGLGIAVLALLLAALSLALGRPDALALYGTLSIAAFALTTWLLRRDRRRGQPRERAVARQPIRLPVRASLLTFAAWYALAAAASALVNGRLGWFDLAAIAPFAAVMLTVLTFAGRHIAFRLTAEENERG